MELTQARKIQWQLGDWLLDAPSLQLVLGDEKVKITSKMQDVLLVLLIHKGRPVAKEVIYQQVWPNVIVSEQLIARAISDLRKVFGDNAKSPQYIETLSKAGYRWLGTITQIETQIEMASSSPVNNQSINQPIVKAVSRKSRNLSALIVLFLSIILVVVTTYLNTSYFFPQTEKGTNTRAEINIAAALPLTSQPGIENAPTISPDGEVLAYVYEEQGSNSSQIILQNVITHKLIAKIPFNSQEKIKQFGPRFSPNGLNLAFTQYDEKQQSCKVYWLALSDLTQQNHVASCANRFKMSLDWSINGKEIYFTQDFSADIRALAAVNIADKTVSQITFPQQAGTTDYSPRVSSDGASLIFVRGKLKPSHHSAIYQITLLESEDSKEYADNRLPLAKALTATEGQGNIFGLSWLEEHSIIYALDQDINQSLRLFSLADDSDLLLAQGSYHRIDYHQKSKTLVFANSQQVSNIVALALNQQKEKSPIKLISSTRKDHQPRVSPNGENIAFVADRSGTDQLWIADINGKEQRQLSHIPKAAIIDVSWSPDGKNLLLIVQTNLLVKPYIFNLDSSKLTAIDTGKFSISDARWSTHTQWLIASCQVDNSWQICRISSLGGKPVILTTASGISPYSPTHSDFIYFTRHGEGLWRMPLLGGKADLVWQDFPEHSWKNWVLYENQLYYLDHKSYDEQTALVKRDLISGENQVIFQGIIKWNKTSFDISPNGAYLYLSTQAPASDDIYSQKIH